MDHVFEEEQQHLRETYAKLERIEEQTARRVEEGRADATRDQADFLDEFALDFAHEDHAIETLIELEAANAVIEGYNLRADAAATRLLQVRQLLRRPYFAKVSLQLAPDRPPRDVYLGSVGMTDERYDQFIVDWRSPVAEVYYNQESGPTSYEANGRTIHVDLLLRRQFDLDRDVLHACFDTTVAIEDPLLLRSLGARRSGKMPDITATIQREQNEVIRHADVPALVVRGVAGSGKTSVLLQRIAYLLYRQRGTLDPDAVCLLTPNPVFGRYIDRVLPDLGERNPRIFTWDDLMGRLGVRDRASGAETPLERLLLLEERLADRGLEARDFGEVRVGDVVLLSARQVQNAALPLAARHGAGPRFAALLCEALHERLDARLAQLAATDEMLEEVLSLDFDEQMAVFGHPLEADGEEEELEAARAYARHRFGVAHDAIEDAAWLRVDHLGCRLLGAEGLTAAEWVYVKILAAGAGDRTARYVMVDEVQDYSAAQLAVLARWYAGARFLLLGDPMQATLPESATFDQVEAVFARERGQVDTCTLSTSYRSTPQVAALFSGLVPAGAGLRVRSVQPDGEPPQVREFAADDAEGYLAALRDEVSAAAARGGLCAVVAADRARVRWLARQLDGLPARVLDRAGALPEEGVVLVDLALAKGLEFDHVIVPDAQAAFYGGDDLSRRRLYTATSRATRHVTLLAQGPLTPLLRQA